MSDGARDESLWWLLKVIAAAGGSADAGDYPHSLLNAFCDDRAGRDDTFNLACERGFTRVEHETSFDTSTVFLTDAGRAYLALWPEPGR